MRPRIAKWGRFRPTVGCSQMPKVSVFFMKIIGAVHRVSGPMAPANKPYVWIKCSELIPSNLSVCRPDQLQENPMIYIRTSIFSYRFGFMNIRKWFWAWVVVLFSLFSSPSSSSFPPLYSILSHDDLFLFYWCRFRTSTMRSCNENSMSSSS